MALRGRLAETEMSLDVWQSNGVSSREWKQIEVSNVYPLPVDVMVLRHVCEHT